MAGDNTEVTIPFQTFQMLNRSSSPQGKPHAYSYVLQCAGQALVNYASIFFFFESYSTEKSFENFKQVS